MPQAIIVVSASFTQSFTVQTTIAAVPVVGSTWAFAAHGCDGRTPKPAGRVDAVVHTPFAVAVHVGQFPALPEAYTDEQRARAQQTQWFTAMFQSAHEAMLDPQLVDPDE